MRFSNVQYRKSLHDIVPSKYDVSLSEKISKIVDSVDGMANQHSFLEKIIAIRDTVTTEIRAIEPMRAQWMRSLISSYGVFHSFIRQKVMLRTKSGVLEVLNFEKIAGRVEQESREKKRLKQIYMNVASEVSHFMTRNFREPLSEVCFENFWTKLFTSVKSHLHGARRGFNNVHFDFTSFFVSSRRRILDSTRTIAVFGLVFFGVYVLANFEAITTISGRYIMTDSVLSPYIKSHLAKEEYIARNRLTDASQEMITAQEEYERSADKKAILPLDLNVTPDDNRIYIPSIGKNIPLTEVADEKVIESQDSKLVEDAIQEALKDGVVRYPGTARPGQLGNVFLTGHSSYYLWAPGDYKDVFALLHQVKIDDELIVYYSTAPGAQRKYTYKVAEIREVKPDEVDVLAPTNDFRLTLMTCTPIGTNLRRLIVTAYLVD